MKGMESKGSFSCLAVGSCLPRSVILSGKGWKGKGFKAVWLRVLACLIQASVRERRIGKGYKAAAAQKGSD